MVSEDSHDLRWLAEVHRLSDQRDFPQPCWTEMAPRCHESSDFSELGEVDPLRSSQRILLEERNDGSAEVADTLHAVPEEILPVVVVPSIAEDPSTAEEPNELLEHVTTRCALNDGELGTDLPPECHLVAPVDGNAETALSIHEPDNPFWSQESFLLVFRTAHVVTGPHHLILSTRCDSDPSSGRFTGFSSI